MTGPEALAVFAVWAHQHGVPVTMKGSRARVEYEAMAVEFFRIEGNRYTVQVLEVYGGVVRWAERLHPDGVRYVRTRIDQPRDFRVVEPGGAVAVHNALEAAWLEVLWWNYCKNLL